MRRAVGLLAVVLLLSGCTALPPPDPAPVAPGPRDARDLAFVDGAPVFLHLRECVEFGAGYPQPSALFFLPAGFAAVEGSDGFTTLVEILYQCRTGDVVIQEQLLALPVVPPEELRDPEARSHYLLLAGASEGLADLHASWGFGDVVEDGTIEIKPKADLGAGSQWGATTATWSTSTTGLVLGEIVPGKAGHARFFHPTDPTRMLQILWSDHEGDMEGTAVATTFVGVPGIPAAFAQGTPTFRSGTQFEWWIQPAAA